MMAAQQSIVSQYMHLAEFSPLPG